MASQQRAEELFDQEEQMLEETPLPNLPQDEKEGREQWKFVATSHAHRRAQDASPIWTRRTTRVLVEILRDSGAQTRVCESCALSEM